MTEGRPSAADRGPADRSTTSSPPSSDTAYFERHFQGRTVLIGAVLDVEDRKLTSRRFVKATDGGNYAERCVHPVMPMNASARDAIPGVYVHAAAIDNLKALSGLSEVPALVRFLCLLALSLAAAFSALRLKLSHAAATEKHRYRGRAGTSGLGGPARRVSLRDRYLSSAHRSGRGSL